MFDQRWRSLKLSRNIALDILKLTMAFMIVGLHAGFLGEYTELGEYLTVNGIFRIAVPIFFIINGFYFYPVLLKKSQSSWFKRVCVLYVFWMVFYSYFWFSIPDFSLAGIASIVKDIIIGYHHLWYISGMIGAAVILLMLHKVSMNILMSSIFIFFSCGVLIQYIGNYHLLDNSYLDEVFNEHWSHRNMLFFSYPFFCIGYLINKYSLQNIVSLKFSFGLSIIGMLMLLGESYANYYHEDRDGGVDNLVSLILVCPFIFILFIKSNIPGKSKNIALYSSAIYFIHSFVLSVFRKFTDLEATLLTLVAILVSVFLSYFIIKANSKLKIML
ncbi:acyltransferase family protein [Vibrio sp. WJH972]